LIVDGLKPLCVHLGIPCTKMCTIGAGVVDAGTESIVAFSLEIMEHSSV